MARYDKYDGVAGGFRCPAKVAQVSGDYDTVLGVGIDATGAGTLKDPKTSGYVGVTIVDRTKRRAGDILDVMTNGEIVEVALTAGTTYYLNATTGVLQTAETRYKVGHTVEADRLVVRFQDQGAV